MNLDRGGGGSNFESYVSAGVAGGVNGDSVDDGRPEAILLDANAIGADLKTDGRVITGFGCGEGNC